MTVSTESATPPKSSKSRHSNSLVQNQIEPKSQFEFVPRDAGKSEFVNLEDFWTVAFPMETVIQAKIRCIVLQRVAVQCSVLLCVAVCCSVLQCVAV